MFEIECALSQAGLSSVERRDLLLEMAKDLDRKGVFPSSPGEYVRRVRELLASAFVPRVGPPSVALPPGEISPRGSAWDFLRVELGETAGRPDWRHLASADAAHVALWQTLPDIANSDIPLPVPPRWAGELFWVFANITALKS